MPTKPKTAEVKATDGKEERGPLLEAFRRLLLASIGAVVIAQEEIEDLVNRLVERGEIAKKDGEKIMKEMMEKRKKEATKSEEEVNKRISDVLDRMNIPGKADIEALGDKIAELSKKVDELKKTQG